MNKAVFLVTLLFVSIMVGFLVLSLYLTIKFYKNNKNPYITSTAKLEMSVLNMVNVVLGNKKTEYQLFFDKYVSKFKKIKYEDMDNINKVLLNGGNLIISCKYEFKIAAYLVYCIFRGWYVVIDDNAVCKFFTNSVKELTYLLTFAGMFRNNMELFSERELPKLPYDKKCLFVITNAQGMSNNHVRKKEVEAVFSEVQTIWIADYSESAYTFDFGDIILKAILTTPKTEISPGNTYKLENHTVKKKPKK